MSLGPLRRDLCLYVSIFTRSYFSMLSYGSCNVRIGVVTHALNSVYISVESNTSFWANGFMPAPLKISYKCSLNDPYEITSVIHFTVIAQSSWHAKVRSLEFSREPWTDLWSWKRPKQSDCLVGLQYWLVQNGESLFLSAPVWNHVRETTNNYARFLDIVQSISCSCKGWKSLRRCSRGNILNTVNCFTHK